MNLVKYSNQVSYLPNCITNIIFVWSYIKFFITKRKIYPKNYKLKLKNAFHKWVYQTHMTKSLFEQFLSVIPNDTSYFNNSSGSPNEKSRRSINYWTISIIGAWLRSSSHALLSFACLRIHHNTSKPDTSCGYWIISYCSLNIELNNELRGQLPSWLFVTRAWINRNTNFLLVFQY